MADDAQEQEEEDDSPTAARNEAEEDGVVQLLPVPLHWDSPNESASSPERGASRENGGGGADQLVFYLHFNSAHVA